MTLAERRDQSAIDSAVALAEVIAAHATLDERAMRRAAMCLAWALARYRFHSLALRLSQLAPLP